MASITDKIQIESKIISLFNKHRHVSAQKTKLKIGSSSHEFDLYGAKEVIGGITTLHWTNKTGSTNTGGQDRVSTELLWLTLWEGNEQRVVILTDREMATKILRRWQGCPFPHQIEIVHYDESKRLFETEGVLGQNL